MGEEITQSVWYLPCIQTDMSFIPRIHIFFKKGGGATENGFSV